MNSNHLLVSGYGDGHRPTIEQYKVDYSVIDASITLTRNWQDNKPNASFLCSHEKRLFAVSEEEDTCMLYLYHLENNTYVLDDQVQFPYGGVCHLTYLATQNLLIASSYNSGCILVVDVQEECFGDLKQLITHPKNTDELSRVHGTFSNSDETLLYATNIATDRIYTYNISSVGLTEQSFYQLAQDSGPRHLVIGKNGHTLYLVTEYSNEVFCFESHNGHLTLIEQWNISTQKKEPTSYGSSICISHDFSELYVALRGLDIITHFHISKEGTLTRGATIPAFGSWPRHIALAMDDTLLVIANQKSHDIAFVSTATNTLIHSLPFSAPSFVL